MGNRSVWLWLGAGIVASLVPGPALACAVCGLDGPGSIPVASLLFLMAMPFVVAGSIGAWLFYMNRRAGGRPPRRSRVPNFLWAPGIVRPGPLGVDRILWAGLILVLIVVVVAGTWSLLRREPVARVGVWGAPPPLAVYGEVPAFSLTERSGRQVSRGDLAGKVWIANFIFTSCRVTCPRQTATMAQLQTDLASEPDIRLVSITVDPDHDTPEVLARYAGRFHADPRRWFFLTGEEQAIYALAQEGFRLSATRIISTDQTPIERAFASAESRAPGGPQASGSTRIVVDDDAKDALVHDARFAQVDRNARIRGYYSSLDPEAITRLLRDVKSLLGQG